MNKKHIIIFGTLILLLIIVVGGMTYYQERESGDQVSKPFGVISRYSDSYPVDVDEFINFIDFCDNAALSIGEVEGGEVTGAICVLVEAREDSSNISALPNSHIPVFASLDSAKSFKIGRYTGFSLKIEDIIKEHDSSLLEEESLYVCSISKSPWLDPFYLEYSMPDSVLFSFEEGGIMCDAIKLDDYPIKTFAGFVPQAESLNIEMHLVNEETITDFLNEKDNQSFSEMDEILNNYPLLWQMEKPINI